jgi:hypothetical protein
MTQKHTPEPWWHSKLEIGDVPMMNTKIAKVSGYSYEEAEANGKRIVECVNALAGCTSEEIALIAEYVKTRDNNLMFNYALKGKNFKEKGGQHA